ncbi:sensor histidine kinase [Streptomyces rishiriensis]|uniref:histidine kinase n=1 Tax=Streptomyces rishiriensis TaxID=68264 RepID=A0ABU0NZX9_STRRH|nr:ATP-binding protein [Streptomyces rishiriensis]MDQ0584659.1 signal transduction histidine kinase [Streptomyces rishiriensis]
MSHLRAPATRADRREGGRHGRPVARPAPAPAETHIRPQLLRLAVLPPTAVALSACAVVLFTVRSTGVRPGVTLWAVLAGAVAVTGVGIVIAAVAADRAARSVGDRVTALRRSSARGEADLRAVIEALRRGEAPPRRTPRGGPPGDADDFELLAADLARAHDGAVTAVVQAAQLSSQAGSEQKLEVFVNLARRLQSLVHREISILDELENAIEDPDLLKGLFHVDHLATRIRRHAENLAVLGGAVSRRQWSNPVSMTEVLRSAIAEVEQYARVKLVPPIDGELRGHAVADVIHLLAELVENATVFSAPHTQVLLRANLVTSGLAVEVEDRGLGMPVEEQSRMNALLADPDQVNVGRLLADGRIGLFVVSQLARRHGIRVRLQNNIYGGVQAVLVVPQALLGTTPGVPGAESRGPDTDGAGLPLAPAAPPAPAGPVRPPLPPAPQPRTARTPDPAQPHDPRGYATGPGLPTGFGYPQDAPGSSPSPSPGRDTDGAGRSLGPARAQGGAPAPGSPESWDIPGAGRTPAPSPAQDTPGSGTPAITPPPQGQPTGPARAAATPPYPVPAEPVPQRPGAPAPLPVRGARTARPNPAEAVPGIRRGDRPVVEEHAGIAPVPRVGAVRGTMGKPQLPRRRAQEHIVPQLRGGPAPRQDSDQPAGHDPGLMAAFQRGIGLAEAQQSLEADVLDPAPYRPPAPFEAPLDPAAHPASDHDRRPRGHGGDADGAEGGAEAGRLVPLPVDVDSEARPPHPSRIPQARPTPAAAPPEAYGARDGLDLPGPERSTARHDGSAPAG